MHSAAPLFLFLFFVLSRVLRYIGQGHLAGYSTAPDSSPSLKACLCHISVPSPPTLALALAMPLTLANGISTSRAQAEPWEVLLRQGFPASALCLHWESMPACGWKARGPEPNHSKAVLVQPKNQPSPKKCKRFPQDKQDHLINPQICELINCLLF